MKGGLCIIYTSLLAISVVSSCALFILTVSEALQAEDVLDDIDLSGLYNVSYKKSMESKPSKLSRVKPRVFTELFQEKTKESHNEIMFTETISVNSVTTDGLPDTGQPPILISLAESAKLDFRTDELLFVNDSEQHNDTKGFAMTDSAAEHIDDDKNVIEKESTEPRLIVKARPMHDIRSIDENFYRTPSLPDLDVANESQLQNIEDDIPVKSETPQEDIPSFSEWAQKQLADAEKKDIVLNHSSQLSHTNGNFSNKGTKLRTKNYASLACGAKVVAVNPEAGSVSSILLPNRDEYMLNKCKSRIWFVVELCEAVQAQKMELANFELFSSTPKDIAVYFSDRFPTREWASVGQFTARDIRDVQNFDLFPHLFGKFIKVEILSHHGTEHYCPISLFKVYGTSEFEVLEKESSQHSPSSDDEDEDIVDTPVIPAVEIEPSKNLFGSARDAVMSIMKKAAQALGKTDVPKNISNDQNNSSTDEMYKKCCSPSHIIVCDNCSESLYNDVFELLSCSSNKLTSLVSQVFLRDTLKCTGICQPYGLDFKSTRTVEFGDERISYINALFPQKYIAAFCNILAIKEKKVVLNTSFESETNVTNNATIVEASLTITDTNLEPDVKLVPIQNNDMEDGFNNTVNLDEPPTLLEQMDNTDTIVPLKDETQEMTKDEVPITEEVPVPEPQEDFSADEKQTNSLVENEPKEMIKAEPKNPKDTTVEKTKEGNSHDEINDPTIIIDGENFISDLDQVAVDPIPSGGQGSLNQNQAQSTIQKESVFLRLSNRVKALERNMSLSGQYLEELSRRYKKQVEEMQKAFEKTILQMTEERRKSIEREQKYLEQSTNLQEHLGQVTLALQAIMEERDNWFGSMTFFKFVIYQTLIITALFYFISKKRELQAVATVLPKKIRKKDKIRRKSVEGVSGHATPSTKKRRPSEEAIVIVRAAAHEELEEDRGEWQLAKKNKKRKTSILHRNCEVEAKSVFHDIRPLPENPILDDEEFFAPVSEPREFNNIKELDEKEKVIPKTNGSFFNNLKSKTLKTRRLSSPAFLRTFNRHSFRNTATPVVRPLEPIFNGKVRKKSATESPTGSLWSESTDVSQNGRQDGISGGKTKKSLKNILKKVF